MLVFSRKKSESIIIGDMIAVTVVEIRGDKVRLGVDAPKYVAVHRGECGDAFAIECQRTSQPIEKLVGPSLVLRGSLLIHSRKKNESIVINGDIKVIVVNIRADSVQLGFESPGEITLRRREVYEAVRRMDGEK